MDIESKTIESLSEKLFNPLELNNDDIYSPLCDVDPDANYFNELNHISIRIVIINMNIHFQQLYKAGLKMQLIPTCFHCVI